MDTKDIIDEMNRVTKNKYSFVFKEATYNQSDSSLLIVVFYKDGVIMTPESRVKAEQYLVSRLPEGFTYKVKFIKNFVTQETIIPKIDEWFNQNMPSVVHSVLDANKTENGFIINLQIDDKTYAYFKGKDGQKKLKEFLDKEFYLTFEIVLSQSQAIEDDEEEEVFEIEPVASGESVNRVIEVSGVEPIIGDILLDNPKYIKDVAEKEGEEVCVCGRIKFFTEHSYARKSKKEPKITDNPADALIEEPTLRYFYKWTLDGFTGKMKCLCFANKNNIEALQSLSDDMQVVVFGLLEKDKFGDSVTLKVKQLSKCVLPDSFEEKIEYKQENKEYRYVFPEAMEQIAQVDLFGALDTPVAPYLQKHDIVVFDFETTGLNVGSGDKIIEIGAVKIKNGQIKEKFMCMVDPEIPIPPDSTKIHGIVDSDVKGAPKIEEAIQDFYKFTRGCVLSGHNVSFDYGFLNKFGRDNRYNFDNPLLDTLQLAMKYVRGVKNYKLKTIAEKLGVTLDNAHRAVYDAIATAEVLIKIAPSIEE